MSGIFGHQCYFFGTEGLNWSEAQNFCESKDGYLVELIDQNERDAVFNYAKGKNIWRGRVSLRVGMEGTYCHFLKTIIHYNWNYSNNILQVFVFNIHQLKLFK